MRVLAIGNTIIDTVLSMPKIPHDDKVWVDSKKTFVGGQGMNAAQDLAILGVSTAVMTRVGDDGNGTMAKSRFEELGIDGKHCITVPDCFTMSATVAIETEHATRACLMHRDPKMFLHDATESIEAAVKDVTMGNFDLVYTDGHQLDLTMPVIRAAVAAGVRTVADVEVVTDDSRRLAALVTDLIVPVNSLPLLADGESDYAAAVIALADRPGRTVIGTAGSEGSYGAQHGDTHATIVPADNRCQPIDTVGAGDAYHAGYIAAVQKGYGALATRMEHATRVAAALCETPGPVVSTDALGRYDLP